MAGRVHPFYREHDRSADIGYYPDDAISNQVWHNQVHRDHNLPVIVWNHRYGVIVSIWILYNVYQRVLSTCPKPRLEDMVKPVFACNGNIRGPAFACNAQEPALQESEISLSLKREISSMPDDKYNI